MAGRNMDLQVIVRLRDLLSGPLRGLQRSLEGIANMAKRIGVVGTAIAAISFMGPIKEAAAFQQQLLDIAGTANLSGQAAFNMVEQSKRQYEQLALEIGQYSDTVAKGAGQMIAAGVDTKLVDQSIRVIGRSATAANAEFNDMAGVATSLLTTLRLPADKLESAMAGLVVAGKEGAFELKDMARYFPTLTGQMIKFGVTGREAVNFLSSALQIARKGTADPAEAANNLKNFLAKVLAPATIKNFEEAGVDIEAVMKDAATKGINPIEAVIQKIVKLTGVSGKEIDGLMKKAKENGQTDAEALATVQEQLKKIYGASQLGELFGDMQVMDFLIPMLANIEEYKRIKNEVANATGSVVDKDFETQMEGLNRQLIIFNEIGTQAVREVGFAFGSWLPMINEYLAALLKWIREVDASTGGMVRQGLSFAGAAIIIAGALGALGIILPIIAAGFGAIAALVGPLGLVIAALGFGIKHIYDNWQEYGPALARIWDNLKQGFVDMVDGGRQLVDRYGPAIARRFAGIWERAASGVARVGSVIRAAIPGILAAGRELADRYGPVLRDGFNQAWADIEAGWKNLQTLFEGFSKGLDLKFDFSGLTIDQAKLAAFEVLDRALNRIAGAWEQIKGFGSGFAQSLAPIGENIGGTVNAVAELASGMWRLATAIGNLIPNVSPESSAAIAKWLGSFTGGALDVVTYTIKTLAQAFADLVNWVADLAEGKKKIDWAGLVPQGLVDNFNSIVGELNKIIDEVAAFPAKMQKLGTDMAQGLMDGITAKIDELVEWFRGLPDRIRAAIGKIDWFSLIGADGLRSYFGGGGPVQPPAPPVTVPANQNVQINSTDKAGSGLARAEAQGQKVAIENEVKVGGSVTVKVDGPGTVTSTATDNSAVPIVTNTGRAVGRF